MRQHHVTPLLLVWCGRASELTIVLLICLHNEPAILRLVTTANWVDCPPYYMLLSRSALHMAFADMHGYQV